ncbi:M15 family metallopeptidase [Cellulomonas sp. NPDC058312]|uniref:M15 family metallopeptidase n=1 Tax=Cellulomonas sp. NPDC058312 TaxID=3346441 RepID=UPI0036E0FA1C
MTDPAPAPAAPPGRRARRVAERGRQQGGRRQGGRRQGGEGRGAGRARVVVASATSTLLVAAVAVAGVQLHAGRERAAEAERTAVALGLQAELAAQEDAFLTDRGRAALLDASLRSSDTARAAREQAAAEAAAAQAAAEAEAARVAEEQAAAEAAAQAQAARDAAAKPGSSGTAGAPGIAGYRDGRPVDAAGNVLWVTSVPTAGGDGSNGHLPMSAMCQIPWGTDQLGFAQYLRCDAADALTALNDAFTAAFGAPLDLDLTYRSYDDQVAMKAAFGGLAAAPGTSSHGLGTALDVQEWPGTYGFGTARYDWLVANGPTYGWYAPARVRQGQPYAEYWHFEYGPGRTS